MCLKCWEIHVSKCQVGYMVTQLGSYWGQMGSCRNLKSCFLSSLYAGMWAWRKRGNPDLQFIKQLNNDSAFLECALPSHTHTHTHPRSYGSHIHWPAYHSPFLSYSLKATDGGNIEIVKIGFILPLLWNYLLPNLGTQTSRRASQLGELCTILSRLRKLQV